MKLVWQRMNQALLGRSLRERVLLLLVAVTLLGLLADTLLLAPQRSANLTLTQALKERRDQVQTLQQQEQALALNMKLDPNESLRARQADLEQQLERIRQGLDADFKRFIAPEDMPSALRALIDNTEGVTLVSLRSLPVEALSVASGELKEPGTPTEQAENPAPSLPRIYKRKVELSLQGGFHGLVKYFDDLNQLPWIMGWEFIQIDSDETGRNRFKGRCDQVRHMG